LCLGIAPYCEDLTRQYAVVYHGDAADANGDGDGHVRLFASGIVAIHGRNELCERGLILRQVFAVAIAVFALVCGGAFLLIGRSRELPSATPPAAHELPSAIPPFASQSPVSNAIDEIRVGARVIIQGLVSRPQLNGRNARVLHFNEASGRYEVGLDDGSKLSLKPECVKRHSAGQGPAAATIPDGCCVICLEGGDPPPIQSGCACRGYSGLAHVACRVEAAQRDESNDSTWFSCRTCGNPFTGEMKIRLAQERFNRSKDLQEDDPIRLTAANNLANSLHLSEGKHAEAEALYRKCLPAQIRIFGPEHPNTLTTTSNLAGCVIAQGRNAEAETIHRKVLAARKRVLGDDHMQTMDSIAHLANSLIGQGKIKESETMYRNLWARQKTVLGHEHPYTLRSAANLAHCLRLLGRRSEAETLLRDTLSIQKRVLGEEHPESLSGAVNVATFLSEQGKFVEAEALQRSVYAARLRVFGSEHPETLNIGADVAVSVLNQGKPREACDQFDEMMPRLYRVYGPNHRITQAAEVHLKRAKSNLRNR
jgi:tetratricopeptide (TPR) repeat protein